MTNEPSMSPHAIDPSWGLNKIASRLNKPIGNLATFPRNYRVGSEYKKATKAEISEKLQEIGAGYASKELPENGTDKKYPQDTLDFDAPFGLEAGVSDLKLKATTLPTEGVFIPLITGSGILDRAAIDPWRTFISVTSSLNADKGFSRELDRGFSR